MRKTGKVFAALLSAAMLATALSGCGQQKESAKAEVTESVAEKAETTAQDTEAAETGAAETEAAAKPDTSEPVTVTMYLIGDRPVDNDEVFEKINERLQAEINTTVEVKFMGWGDYEQKYPLIFASGEDWDIIYTADWCFYNAQATKQGFYEITQEALETYAPMTAETMYPEAWEKAKVNGKVYALPMNYKEITAYVYMVRGDLMDKYGITSVASLDEAEAYMDAIAQNEPTMIPIDVGSDYDKMFLYERMRDLAYYESDEKIMKIGPWQTLATSRTVGDLEVIGDFERPEFLDVIKRLQDWRDRGFWSRNAVVNTQNNTESFQAGKSALAMMNINTAKSLYGTIMAEHPEWDIRVFDAQNGVPAALNSYMANAMSIFSKSKNPERALMVLDYLRNDEICHNLFSYGIEGKHWEASGDTGLKFLDASSNYPYDGNCNWGIRNDAFWRNVEGGIPNYDEMYSVWADNCTMGPFADTTFDDSAVKNEIAAMTEILNNEFKLLALGFTDDPEGDIAKLVEKMEAAGCETVFTAIEEQAAETLNK